MRIELDAEAAVVIEGDAEELDELRDTLRIAIEEGKASGHLLGDDGVEDFLVRCVDDD